PDTDPILKLVKTALASPEVSQAGIDPKDFMAQFPGELRLLYLGVAGLTVLYQGGMALYYLRRRAAVEAAIEEDAGT
ncbi:MAG TPA: hypothetical protein VN877_05920, partial [Opitutaceae bacterium]|nr:hypothetical protein [Opitutaceae bacterium]